MSLYDLTKAAVKDDSGRLLDPTDYDAAVVQALKRYSAARPRLVCEDLAGSGEHDLALPAGWCEGFSTLVSIEYPVGNVPETLLNGDDWILYQSPAGFKLRLIDAVPTATETVRVLYSVLHSEATVPVADTEAVANLAASLCLRQLAAGYGNAGDSTIQADSVNHQSKTDEYRRLADSFEKLYAGHLGIGSDAPVVASMATAAPATSSRRWRLTH